MNRGRVYTWTCYPETERGRKLSLSVVPLQHLDTYGEGCGQLWGRFVKVRNGGMLNEPDPISGEVVPVPIGNAQPDAAGDFLFEPGRGGGRMDRSPLVKAHYRSRFLQASHFGEVNAYYHLDLFAAYVAELLRELGEPPLPRITAVVNAHHAATFLPSARCADESHAVDEKRPPASLESCISRGCPATETDGVRDGIWRHGRWLPFQGGHYRLPSRHFDIPEYEPIAASGEIHLGPGWQLLEHGALVELTGKRYRANASHNAGILYHEYGHHITRHTADLRANSLRRPERQDNRKTAMDEGTCDYWAATMLDTPHIWAWHRRHDAQAMHPRSLVSAKTMDEYDAQPDADAHANGTIWAAALWDVREALRAKTPAGIRHADLLVLKTLLLLGQPLHVGPGAGTTNAARKHLCRARESFAVGLAALLQADELLYTGQHIDLILASFARRGIQPVQYMSIAPGIDTVLTWHPGRVLEELKDE